MAIFTLNTTKSGTGKGTVTSDVGIPPINCGPTCIGESDSQSSGSTVTLTATPQAGSVFVRWTGNAAGLPSTSNVFVFQMNDNPTNINAEFKKKKGGFKYFGRVIIVNPNPTKYPVCIPGTKQVCNQYGFSGTRTCLSHNGQTYWSECNILLDTTERGSQAFIEPK